MINYKLSSRPPRGTVRTMSTKYLWWLPTRRKALMLLGAIFIAWSWYVQKPAPAAAAPDPQMIEYIFA
jgi:hypothetical protein